MTEDSNVAPLSVGIFLAPILAEFSPHSFSLGPRGPRPRRIKKKICYDR